MLRKTCTPESVFTKRTCSITQNKKSARLLNCLSLRGQRMEDKATCSEVWAEAEREVLRRGWAGPWGWYTQVFCIPPLLTSEGHQEILFSKLAHHRAVNKKSRKAHMLPQFILPKALTACPSLWLSREHFCSLSFATSPRTCQDCQKSSLST